MNSWIHLQVYFVINLRAYEKIEIQKIYTLKIKLKQLRNCRFKM